MICGTVEIQMLERRATAALCQHSGKKWILLTNVLLFSCVMRHGVSDLSEIRRNCDAILLLWDSD